MAGPLLALKQVYPNSPYLPIVSKPRLMSSHGHSIRCQLRIDQVGDLSVVLPYDMTSKRINLGACFRRPLRSTGLDGVFLAIVDASELLVLFLAIFEHLVDCMKERIRSSFFHLHH